MRKHIFGRQLSRDANERKALFKTLASSLVMEERVQTTHAKAKAIRPYIEKLVTKAGKGRNGARLIEPYLTKLAAEKMMQQIAPRFVGRPGGYTRIIFAGNRIADHAAVAVIEFVEKGQVLPAKKSEKKTKVAVARKTEEKKIPAKKALAKASAQKEKKA